MKENTTVKLTNNLVQRLLPGASLALLVARVYNNLEAPKEFTHVFDFSQILILIKELTQENWLTYMQKLGINQIFASNSRNNSIYFQALCYCAFSFGPFVRSRLSSSTSSQSPSRPSPKRACPRDSAPACSQFFLSKILRNALDCHQKSTKRQQKRAQGDSNESLWTLRFYSETYLKRCSERTKLGAGLGRFWVGQGQNCYRPFQNSLFVPSNLSSGLQLSSPLRPILRKNPKDSPLTFSPKFTPKNLARRRLGNKKETHGSV